MAPAPAATARYAFATLVTTDEYLPAALVLAHSLRQVHSDAHALSHDDLAVLDSAARDPLPQLGPWGQSQGQGVSSSPPPHRQSADADLVALVTPATLSVQSVRALLRVYDRVIGVETLGFESVLAMKQRGQVKSAVGLSDGATLRHNQANLDLLGRADLASHRGAPLTKLHAWRLQEYRKVVFLDADTLVLRPIAHLLGSAASFAACPDTGWPDIFNSGVMALTPSVATFDGLLELAAETGSWDGADQGLINEYFGGETGSGAEGRGGGWTRLPFVYNVTALGGYTYAPAFQRHGVGVKVAHFIGDNKPWRTHRPPSAASAAHEARRGNMAASWWDVYRRYYPVSGTTTPSGSQGTVEVRFTDRGVEVIDRVSAHNMHIPVYQAAWEASGDDSGSARAASVQELKQMFGPGHRASQIEYKGEGRYESLPLFGRLDLLPPQLLAASQVGEDSPQAQSADKPNASAAPHEPPQPPSDDSSEATPTVTPRHVTWDATVSSPPHGSSPTFHQMRDPPDTYFANVWDQPAVSTAEAREEAARRRQFFNPNLQNKSRDFGYIPHEAKEIHDYQHLGGDKPDQSKINPIFPWEERAAAVAAAAAAAAAAASNPASANTRSRSFLSSLGGAGSRGPIRGADSSVGHSAEYGPTGGLQASRRFDNYVVPPQRDGVGSPHLSSSPSASASEKPHASSMPFNLVQRYTNAWDLEPEVAYLGSGIAQSRIDKTQQRERAQEYSRRGASSSGHSRRRSRADSLRQARIEALESSGAMGNSSSGGGGTGTAYQSATSGLDDPAATAAGATRSYRTGSVRGGASTGYASATTAAYHTAASSNLASAAESTASDRDVDDSQTEHNFYTRQLGFSDPTSGGGPVGEGPFGPSSWSRDNHAFVRMGSRGGKPASVRTLRPQIPHEYVIPAEGGGSGSGGGHGGLGAEGTAGSRFEGSEEDGDDESSSDDSQKSSRRARRVQGRGSGHRHGSTDNAFAVTPSLEVSVDDPQAAGSLSVHSHGSREGPGYTRRAQASSVVRSHATPRSPRNSNPPLGGDGSTSGDSAALTGLVGQTSGTGGGSSPPPPPPPEALAHALPLTGRARIKPGGRSSYGA